jgi:hypothetical protein
MCWIHTKSKAGLRVKKSEAVPHGGKGLYATKVFNPGKVVGKYMGEDVTAQVHAHPDEFRPYTLCNEGNNKCLDARKTNSTPVRYINDKRGTNRAANVEFGEDFKVRTTRKVLPNREFLVDYGPEYWPAEHTKSAGVKKAAKKTVGGALKPGYAK